MPLRLRRSSWRNRCTSNIVITICGVVLLGTIQAAAAPIVLDLSITENKPLVEVWIKGQGPFHFVVDTGTADPAVLSEDLVKKLGLTPSGKDKSVDAVTGTAVEVPQYTIALRIGKFSQKNVKALAIPLPGRDGIVGFPMFKDYLYQLDLAGKKIVLSKGSLPAADNQTIFECPDPDGIPSLSATMGQDSIKFAVDSGSDGGMMLPFDKASHLQFQQPAKVVARVQTSQAEFDIKAGRAPQDLVLGRYKFSEPMVSFAEIFRGGNLGFLVLKEFVITFDQAHKRVRWERANPIVQVTEF